MAKLVGEGLTYDDVLLLPQESEVLPARASTRTRLCRGVEIPIPIASAAMDTVTESRMAVALAQQGGIGIVHKNLPVARQVAEVEAVKRSANGVILDPVTLRPDATVGDARDLMQHRHCSGLPIVDERDRVLGILTNRDLRFVASRETRVRDVMTRAGLITAGPSTTLDEARAILQRNKVEKLILVDGAGHLAGLITIKDINMLEEFPQAARDGRGRLRVGAAVGVQDPERVAGLVAAGCDVIVVDTAHGHTRNVMQTVRDIKRAHDVPVVAGNVATREATRALIDAGADGVKVGIGPGSICTTRVVTGVGVPQFTAVLECAEVAREAGDIPVIADGGIKSSGDIAKALAAGAACVMLGSLLAGLDEAPGETVLYRGRTFKAIRGMGSLGAMAQGSADRYGQADIKDRMKLVPEGVEGMVPYKGQLKDYVHQLVGGVRASMGYLGAGDLASFHERAHFVRVTGAGVRESHPHDIRITREAPNYSGDFD